MLSDLKSELFITQSSFSGSTSIELSENNFESLFAGADNEKAIDNFNLRTVLDIVLRNHFTPIKELATRRKKLCPMFCKDQQLIFRGPQWKAMNHRLRKSANMPQKKTLLSSILEIVASYLIFPHKDL